MVFYAEANMGDIIGKDPDIKQGRPKNAKNKPVAGSRLKQKYNISWNQSADYQKLDNNRDIISEVVKL